MSQSFQCARVAVVALILAAPIPGRSQTLTELPDSDRPLNVAAEPVYTVGSMDGALWETFSEVNQVGFDDDGNLYVLDSENFRVVVVTPQGTLLREVGHEGGGPGEFRNPAALAVYPDGRMAIFDIGHRALIFFDAQGEYQGQRAIEPAQMPGLQLEPLPDGDLVSATGQGLVTMTAGPDGPRLPTSIPIHRYAWGESGPVYLLYDAWLPELAGPTSATNAGPIRMVGLPQPKAFGPTFSLGALPDGRVAFTDTTTYSIKLLSPDGNLEQVLSRPIRPRPVTRRDQERERERRLEVLSQGGGPQVRMRVQSGGGGAVDVPQDAIRKMLEERVASLQFAEEFPVVSALATDWEGRIWVERTARDYQDDGPIDVLSPEGEYLGTISPGGVRIPDAFGPDGLVAYLEAGELDVPMVVVRRLDW